MDKGTPLRAAEDGDLPVPHGAEREEIHHEVESHPRGEAIDGSKTENHRFEGLFAHEFQNADLGMPARLGIERERANGRSLREKFISTLTIDTARGGEDEAPHAEGGGAASEGDGGRPVRLNCDLLVLRARLVPHDRGEMDHGIRAFHRFVVGARIAEVARHDFQPRLSLETDEPVSPVEHAIDNPDVLPGGQQSADENRSDVSRSARDDDRSTAQRRLRR